MIKPKKLNSNAPNFSLKDQHGQELCLKNTVSDYVVLFFYPKDSTPGCTLEAQEFTKHLTKFNKINCMLFGISGGDLKSKQKFCEKHKLKVALLSDSDFAVSKKYGVYGDKKFMGRTFKGIVRTTFVLDKNKKIIKVFENVKASGHANEVLEYLSAND